MGISIYYAAKRQHHLSNEEKSAIEQIVSDSDVMAELDNYLQTGLGYNWETFTIYEPDFTSDTIFDGATKLPDNSEDAILTGLEHWLNTLSLIRHIIPDAAWHVHLDDTDIPWNSATRSFDTGLLS